MPIRKHLILAIVVLTGGPALGTAPRRHSDAAHRLVVGLEERWMEAFHQGNARAVAGLYEPDAWLLLPGTPPLKGRRAIGGAIRSMAVRGARMRLKTDRVTTLARGVLIEDGTATYLAPGRPPVRSSYQVVWRRDRHGSWHALRDVVTPL